LKLVLQQTKELKVYIANHGFHITPLKLDEGYLLIQYGIGFQEFLLESDAPKIKSSNQMIEELCRNQWSSVQSKHESFYKPNQAGFGDFPNPSGVWVYQPETIAV